MDTAKANLHLPLSVEDLSNVVHLSPRQFRRAFKRETGRSPTRASEGMRVEAARDMITAGTHPLSVLATKTGFGDVERMRRAFQPSATRLGACAAAQSPRAPQRRPRARRTLRRAASCRFWRWTYYGESD